MSAYPHLKLLDQVLTNSPNYERLFFSPVMLLLFLFLSFLTLQLVPVIMKTLKCVHVNLRNDLRVCAAPDRQSSGLHEHIK